MSANEIDLQPDTDQVLQVETGPEPAVLVEVQGPVATRVLPNRPGASFTRTGVLPISVTNPAALRVLRADHRRAVAYITSFDQDMYLGFNLAESTDVTRMTRWPASTPYPCGAFTDVYVAAFASTCSVSVATELWATGGE